MILTRTPLRVSLFGGGSHLPSYYNENVGKVLSFTIDKYMYIALCRTALQGIKVVYNEVEQAVNLEDVKHSRVRECLRDFDVHSHIEISSFCEIPTKGTGLGSSSTFTVGLINALSELKGISLNKADIARNACFIEMQMCNEPIGKQDQYAAAYGGCNIFEFNPKDYVTAINPGFERTTLTNLNKNLMMFYTGISRNASDILGIQSNSTTSNLLLLHTMVDMVDKARSFLLKGDVDSIGAMLDEGWQLKKQLAYNVSNDLIDIQYKKAIQAGALGGKILGAGGGGYWLFYVPLERQDAVRKAMGNLQEFNFNFEDTGTTVVYNESK